MACAVTGGVESTIDVQGMAWKVHVFTVSGTLGVTCEDASTNPPSVEYLIVGGGAGAKSDAGYYHSGGGGGAVLSGATTLTPGDVAIIVGKGGAEAADGEASHALGLVALGGTAAHTSAGYGGVSGAGTAGGACTVNGGSGGGGGAGGPGGNADWGDGNYYFWGGRGGAGIASSITGQTVSYGGGGSGQGWHFNVNGTRIQNGVTSFGDYRALGSDGGATAIHCPLGGTIDSAACPMPLDDALPSPNSGGGGADVYVNGPAVRDGADGVVVVRYPISPIAT
jgi:hypothetical protein